MDKLTNYIRYWQAAGESEKISERTRTRIRQLTEEGYFTGGQCPYGYQLVRGKRLNKKNQPMNDLQICEAEAQIIRLMFDKATREGLGPLRIANYLNEQGVTTRKGKRWNQASISRILTNRLYLGYLQKGGVESPHQPELQIIDEERFQRAQEIRKVRTTPRDADAPVIPLQTGGQYLLSGFLYCAHCGARANGTASRKEYRRKDGSLYRKDRRTYRCNASIDGVPVACDGPRTYRAEHVDVIFKAAISTLLEQLEALPVETILEYKYQIAIQERREQYRLAQNELEDKERDYKTLRNEIAKALRGESQFALKLLRSLLADMEQTITSKTAQIHELEAMLQNAEQLRREVEVKQRKYCGLHQIFQRGTMAEKKMLLSILIQRVEIGREYELNIKLSPGFEQFLDGLIELR